ncbi:hypothetical protein JRQ81_015185 [Phrynocephalus forsythii]|uniref:Reverse transcriptase RNase H-like domain-containing protein n=1 Tax=Phrynocephalus forsythii TaxID=171643 RepID=A0A9Q0XZ33_9SAUR|nr:hypothetical protein JRQ81_015185 [Phrynocephalus forsythii]
MEAYSRHILLKMLPVFDQLSDDAKAKFAQQDRRHPLRRHRLSKRLRVTSNLHSALQRWATPSHLHVGHPFKQGYATVQITTNASTTGWGTHCQAIQTHGRWPNTLKGCHINFLELMMIFNTLKSFAPLIHGRSIQIGTDNTTVLHYINKQGGTRSCTLLNLTGHLDLVLPQADHAHGSTYRVRGQCDCGQLQQEIFQQSRMEPVSLFLPQPLSPEAAAGRGAFMDEPTHRSRDCVCACVSRVEMKGDL